VHPTTGFDPHANPHPLAGVNPDGPYRRFKGKYRRLETSEFSSLVFTPSNPISTLRARASDSFDSRSFSTVCGIFCCKTAQSCATPCEPTYFWPVMKNTLRKIVKNCAKSRL
jgi:hypothetical protein